MNRAERRRLAKSTGQRTADVLPSDLAAVLAAAHRDLSAGRLAAAKAGYERVLAARPGNPDALLYLGVVAHRSGATALAEAMMRRAIEAGPRRAAFRSNLGNLLMEIGRTEEAVAAHREAVRLAPDNAHMRSNLANALRELGDYDAALAAYAVALRGLPDDPDVLSNLAATLQEIGRLDEAEAHLRRAYAVAPTDVTVNYNLAMTLFSLGAWSEVWEHYEWRWRTPRFPSPRRAFPQPAWDGGPLAGGRLLLWAEQGVGDEILFASCVPDALDRGGPVEVECEPRLAPLFARSFGVPAHPRPYVAAEQGDIPFAAQLPFASLPRLFRRSLADFPRRRAFLRSDPGRAAFWRDRVTALGPGLKVGVCWRSGHITPRRNIHYVGIAELAPLFALPGVVLVNLQYGDCAAELEDARARFGVTLHGWPDIDLREQLDEVAALASSLDVVVSAATATSMLAGALGVPTLQFAAFAKPRRRLESGASPWLPATRVFARDDYSGWPALFADIARTVAERRHAAHLPTE